MRVASSTTYVSVVAGAAVPASPPAFAAAAPLASVPFAELPVFAPFAPPSAAGWLTTRTSEIWRASPGTALNASVLNSAVSRVVVSWPGWTVPRSCTVPFWAFAAASTAVPPTTASWKAVACPWSVKSTRVATASAGMV